MKKIILMAAAVSAITLSSCVNNEEPRLEQSIGLKVYNLITPVDESKEPYFSLSDYTFARELYAGTVDMSCSNLIIDNRSYAFNTGTLQSQNVSLGMLGGFSLNTPYVFIDSNTKIQSLQALVTSGVYGPNTIENLPIIESVSGVADYTTAAAITFEVPGVANVKTFQRDTYYGGNTKVETPTGVYENSKIYYRFVLDMEKMKATAVFYFAQFAEQMPQFTFILRDLDLKLMRDTYSITGKNVIPEGIDGVKYPPFVFDTFSFVATGNNLTNATVNYTVAGKYTGNFTGSYVVPLTQQNN